MQSFTTGQAGPLPPAASETRREGDSFGFYLNYSKEPFLKKFVTNKGFRYTIYMGAMNIDGGYTELVRQAQLGDKRSLDNLAGLFRPKVCAYVYRVILQDDATDDIVQETMLDMCKGLGKLENIDCFWPWLRAIAFREIQHYYAQKKRRKEKIVLQIAEAKQGMYGRHTEAELAEMITGELKEIIFLAISKLPFRQRKVLTMRCYERMSFAQIADLIGCSELNSKVVFYRAKKRLRKELSRCGYGKGSLLTALAIFGKLTAPDKAAAAEISVTPALSKVGVTASVLGAASGKEAILTLTAVGMISAGTVVAPGWFEQASNWIDKTSIVLREKLAGASKLTADVGKDREECWYYYPTKANEAVMIRKVICAEKPNQSYREWLHDAHCNYYYDGRDNTIYINNHRMWNSDFSVLRLPTDRPKLSTFLSMFDGCLAEMDYIQPEGDGLLVMLSDQQGQKRGRTLYHYNVADEEYFRYSWPRGAKIVDNCDEMHRRGWTFFRVKGSMQGSEISGVGRIPFVFAALKENYPWLRLQVQDELMIIDAIDGARLLKNDRGTVVNYTPGVFFRGLARPWMGLHTIDIVRRDAAKQSIFFETKSTANNKVEVTLSHKDIKIVYHIDMENDLIDEIDFLRFTDAEHHNIGMLEFSYLQRIDEEMDDFTELKVTQGDVARQQEDSGNLWLIPLAKGEL
ncbi:MAG: sigma-70 family RNA polymerase sigma factor [Sedimentisphaerales bacterium]|nr:sigma-70 family RNA polymerase sigma factor [Sedimentisphaerales bacterium]